MSAAEPKVLTLNGGSSSVRFGVYRAGALPERRLRGHLDRIGRTDADLRYTDAAGQRHEVECAADDPASAAEALLDALDAEGILHGIGAIGHRLVHGMGRVEPELVTQELLDDLRRFEAVDPDHLPGEIALIEGCRRRLPALPQVACFDTAFHRHLPRVARLLALPRRLQAAGVQRYGFHGLSYAYLMEELARTAGPAAAEGRVILAHLGSGASLAAVRGGVSIDTSMGFTPASGLPMGTRSGDLDPGLAAYLERTEGMTPTRFDAMVNHESGLLGVSETSSDMRDLLAREGADPRAADAVALFCYQAKKWIGAYAAALGGLDTLVFAGGIGENAAPVRARICDGLGFLGIVLDEPCNAAGADVISSGAGAVSVRVIRTDEEAMLARSVCRLLDLSSPTKAPS